MTEKLQFVYEGSHDKSDEMTKDIKNSIVESLKGPLMSIEYWNLLGQVQWWFGVSICLETRLYE